MRAVTQRRFGGPDVLELVDVAPPKPRQTEIVVRVHAIGVNPVEPAIRRGSFPLLGEPPFVLGWDVSGVVEQAAPQTWRFEVGEEVFGMPLFPRQAGAYAELVAAPAIHFARKPPGLDHLRAAALPLAGLTAWQGLVDLARIEPGQRVLIHGGGGGVGHIAVQLAKALGAYVVTSASAAKHDFLLELGADEVIDYAAHDFRDAAGELDVVFDLAEGAYGEQSLAVLRPGGCLVTAVDRTNTQLAASARAAGVRFAAVAVEPDRVALAQLAALADEGTLRIHVERTFPLDQVAAAHELVEAPHATGKVVMTID